MRHVLYVCALCAVAPCMLLLLTNLPVLAINTCIIVHVKMFHYNQIDFYLFLYCAYAMTSTQASVHTVCKMHSFHKSTNTGKHAPHQSQLLWQCILLCRYSFTQCVPFASSLLLCQARITFFALAGFHCIMQVHKR